MSLIMGALFASLIGYGAYRTSSNPKDCIFLLVASGTLLIVMGYRFVISGKFMPAGLAASISALQVVRLLARLLW